MFLSVCPEVRCLIYKFVYQQPEGELLGLSKEPAHEYDHGLPSDWIADSGQRGLVYGSDTDRTEPTNSRFLRTCRLINSEATPIFYGANTIILYAEDNNDIFHWLLDIGERNRRALRHLEINWAYGVRVESGRKNMHGVLQEIEYMEDSREERIRKQQQQLIQVCQRDEKI